MNHNNIQKITIIFLCVFTLFILGAFARSKVFDTNRPISIVKDFFVNKTPPPKIPIPDSLVWNEIMPIPWEARDSQTMYEFGGKLWMTGGLNSNKSRFEDGMPSYEEAVYYNDIWNTEDGINWNKITEHAQFPPIRSASIVNYKGSLYMLGGWSPVVGTKNGIWKSNDGFTWMKVASTTTFTEREGQDILEWNGRLWMFGGVDYYGRKIFNDVWYSDDAIVWTKATSSAPWAPRWDHGATVYKNRLWVVGGMAFGGVGYGDVWNTEDGVNWNRVLDLGPFGKRQGQILLSYGDVLYLVGGLDAKTNEGVGDVWYTIDGLMWSQIPAVGPWLGKEDHSVVLWKDSFFLLGGMNSDWTWKNDVWKGNFTKYEDVSKK